MGTTTNRRGALATFAHGALSAAGVAALTGTVAKCSGRASAATFSPSPWGRAVAVERTTWETMQKFDREVLNPSADRFTQLRESFGTYHQPISPEQRAQLDAIGHDQRQAEFDRLYEIHSQAYGAMLNMPAPSLAALAHKLERIKANGRYGIENGDSLDAFAVIVADAARLAREA